MLREKYNTELMLSAVNREIAFAIDLRRSKACIF